MLFRRARRCAQGRPGRAAIVLAAFLGLLGTKSSLAAERVALVIGNSAYQHTVALPNPRNDAADLAAMLRRVNFDVIEGIDLDHVAMKNKIREFSRALVGADVGLLFYAGHGLQVGGKNYLAPIDTRLSDESDLDFETVELDLVLRQMERSESTSLVFLDACRDNPLARALARSMGATRSGSIGRGLAPIESGLGTLIAYATQPGNVAQDGTGRNSPFTTALLTHIDKPGLPIGQLLINVRNDVVAATNRQQIPWDHSSLTGEFYFRPAAETVAVAPVSPGSQQGTATWPGTADREALFWDSIKNSTSADDFADYLQQFPDGTFAGLAERRLKKFDTPETAVAVAPTPAARSSNISPLDEFRVAVKTANIRAEPTTASSRVGQLKPGVRIAVTGLTSIDGAPWYRVELDNGGNGFVFGSLLQDEAVWAEAERQRAEAKRLQAAKAAEEASLAEQEAAERRRKESEKAARETAAREAAEDPAATEDAAATTSVQTPEQERIQEVAFWNSITSSKDKAQFHAYLEKYPNGAFAADARLRISSIEAAELAMVAPQKSDDPLEPIRRYLASHQQEFEKSLEDRIIRDTDVSHVKGFYSIKPVSVTGDRFKLQMRADVCWNTYCGSQTQMRRLVVHLKQNGDRYEIIRFDLAGGPKDMSMQHIIPHHIAL